MESWNPVTWLWSGCPVEPDSVRIIPPPLPYPGQSRRYSLLAVICIWFYGFSKAGLRPDYPPASALPRSEPEIQSLTRHLHLGSMGPVEPDSVRIIPRLLFTPFREGSYGFLSSQSNPLVLKDRVFITNHTRQYL